jgi:hypothetical protein
LSGIGNAGFDCDGGGGTEGACLGGDGVRGERIAGRRGVVQITGGLQDAWVARVGLCFPLLRGWREWESSERGES